MAAELLSRAALMAVNLNFRARAYNNNAQWAVSFYCDADDSSRDATPDAISAIFLVLSLLDFWQRKASRDREALFFLK